MTAVGDVGARQERRVWSRRVAGWGVGASFALLVAYLTDVPTIQLSSNRGAVVYAEPWIPVVRAALFLLLGAAAVGFGVYLATVRDQSATPSRRAVTLRVVSWMTAFVVAALVVWFRDPVAVFIAGPPGPNIAMMPTGGASHGIAHMPALDGLKTFALLFGFLGGGLSTLSSVRRAGLLANVAASLAMAIGWAGAWLLAAIVLPLVSYLAILSVEMAPALIPAVLLVPGFIAGIIAAAIALPLQRRLGV